MPEGEGFKPETGENGLSAKDLHDLERMMNPDATKDEVPFEPVGHVFRAKRHANDTAALEREDFSIADMFPEVDGQVDRDKPDEA